MLKSDIYQIIILLTTLILAMKYATSIHQALIGSVQKLLLNNQLSCGVDMDWIARHDGCSSYLLGGVIDHQNQGGVRDNPKKLVKRLLQQKDLPDLNLISGAQGYLKGRYAGRVLIYAGDSKSVLSQRVALPPAWQTEKLKEEVASLQLELLSKFLCSSKVYKQDIQRDALYRESKKLENFNQRMWKKVFPFIDQYLDTKKISLGESFTAGIITHILANSGSAKSVLDKTVIWYDPRLKARYGAKKEHLSLNQIASSKTISNATLGLLKSYSKSSSLAIGSTGFANYKRGKADHFSLAIAEKNAKSFHVSTVEVEVTYSKDHEKSYGRRQLTRNLGGTVALLLLIKKIAQSMPQNKQVKKIEEQIMKKIHNYAKLRFKS